PYLSLYPTSTPHIPPLSLHDALPISDDCMLAAPNPRFARPVSHVSDGEDRRETACIQFELNPWFAGKFFWNVGKAFRLGGLGYVDRKSTRLNSSHVAISYAVFCLKKK